MEQKNQAADTAEAVSIPCADGRKLAGSLFAAARPRGAVLVAAGLGIPRRFYAAYAADLAQRGFTALSFDYRGCGESIGSDAQDGGVRYADWGAQDIQAGLVFLRQRCPGLPLLHVGHSAGGQLLGLAPDSERLACAVMVAATAPHISQYQARARRRIWLLWHVLVPLLGAGRVRFPMHRAGLSTMDVPAGAVRQWAAFGRSRRYLFNPRHGLDTARYRRLALPLLSLEFTDDTAFAPAPAVDALLAELPNITLTRRRWAPADGGVSAIGHLGFFKPALRDTLWAQVAEWMLERV